MQRGQAVGEPYSVTTLKSAAFVRPGENEWIEHIRHPISGLLVGGFGCWPRSLFGLLHPNPVRPFDAQLLETVPFCRLISNEDRHAFRAEWIQLPSENTDG